MARTFDDRLAALRAGIENQESAASVVVSALGIAGHNYATDTAMIRELFAELNTGRARFDFGIGGTVVGKNETGRSVVSALLEIEDAGGSFTPDLNGRYAPALWLRALVSVLAEAAFEAERLAEQRSGFGCMATVGE